MSVGILTSGGDAPGMNAAVRAVFRAVKMREPDREIVFFRDGFRGLAGRLDSASDRNVDRRAVRDIIHRGGTFIGTGRVNELRTPDADDPALQERLAAQQAFLRVATANLFQFGISDLIVIGGDGSFRGASLIARSFRETFPLRPFRVIGLPATIDNDIWGTELSIGFDTALNNVVDAMRKIRDTVESHRRAVILEVMGNTSGWLALGAAIAGGAAHVAIPEVPESWDPDAIMRRLIAGARRDYRYFILVVAEGVMKRAGANWADDLRHRIETSRDITEAFGTAMDARINSLGHIARGGSPTATDNMLAGLLGAGAADIIQIGNAPGNEPIAGDVMIGNRGNDLVVHPLQTVVERCPRLVSRDSAAWRLCSQLMLQDEQPF